ncbi:hypothetical protein TRFO_13157 [Tritrichomonas foetus]|uniref:Uncharacterized protein n=1 Tax=Tritrichomonas foetus TaxID=1144522 RepID=A0A1J4KZ80_9EUKA|nr:hypothetical protein TRFO_13157 [Tritrichomonas foetus]|eukprot:OHT16559.1 hypothetical protein TRFO_13157 [Tritrichomonas foetus]
MSQPSNAFDFDFYFNATEESFAAEKQQMLDRVEELRKSWEEVVELDRTAVQKCTELNELKNILSKNHLQILRTREEILNAECLNAKLQFQNRLLQNEIWRLLPYAETDSSTIDYKIALDHEQFEQPKIKKVIPDQKYSKVLSELLRKWEDLASTQHYVFEEEVNLRNKDEACFESFLEDYQKQNADAHQRIDVQLDELLQRINAEKFTNTESVSQHKSMIDAMDRKKENLLTKASEFEMAVTQKKIRQRTIAQKKGATLCNAARERIRNIERLNVRRYEMMKSQDAELNRLYKEKTETVKKLKDKSRRLKKNNNGFLKQGKIMIEKLECQLNALISAAAAMKLCPFEEHQYIINAVSSAVKNQAEKVMTFDEMSLKVKNMGDRIGKLAQVFL